MHFSIMSLNTFLHSKLAAVECVCVCVQDESSAIRDVTALLFSGYLYILEILIWFLT